MIVGNYAEDSRLDIVVLGPMDNANREEPSSGRIRQALEAVLASQEAREILLRNQVTASRIYIPEDWKDQEIVAGVLARLDIADLVILNLTPKKRSAKCERLLRVRFGTCIGFAVYVGL